MTSQVTQNPANVEAIIGTAKELCDRGLTGQAEVTIAGYVLWILEQVERGAMSTSEGDGALTLLDVWVGDRRSSYQFSEEVQDLLNEGELLHHYGDPSGGPDLNTIRRIALQVLMGR